MTRTALLPCLFAVGCSLPMDLGEDRADAAPRSRPRADECGNGIDDDHDGRVDDGCPCAPGEMQECFSGELASSRAGVCAPGTQICVTGTGREWGDWGESACTGERPPAANEICDGADHDCDGAIDEGCPCADGEMRACGDEFLVAPCTAGTQTCRVGTWGACEGAVRPSADVCEDRIDNDCDGDTNEGCECTPGPEVCRDGMDNDCDREVDEPACTPDWGRDAGTATRDAGTCDPGIAPPRLIAPISITYVGNNPTFRWVDEGSTATEWEIQVCADSRCSTIVYSARAIGLSHRASALPRGLRFWRLRGVRGDEPGCEWSSTWEMFVRPIAYPTEQVHELAMDINRDGLSDFFLGPDGYLGTGFGSGYMPSPRPAGVQLFLGTTDGSWDTTLLRWPEIDDGSGALANIPTNLGDADGDGLTDYATPTWTAAPPRTPRPGRLFRGADARIGATPITLPSPIQGGGVGDLDQDGYADILTHDSATDPGHVLFGPPGAYVRVNLSGPLNRPTGCDTNGNGRVEIVSFSEDSVGSHVRVTLTFQEATSARAFVAIGALSYVFMERPASDLTGVRVFAMRSCGDVDGDGYADLILSREERVAGESIDGDMLVVSYGSASGPTGPTPFPDLPGWPYRSAGGMEHVAAVTTVDIDGDGLLEVRLAGSITNRSYIYAPRSVYVCDASLTRTWSCRLIETAPSPGAAEGHDSSRVGDTNGDGFEDLLIQYVNGNSADGFCDMGLPGPPVIARLMAGGATGYGPELDTFLWADSPDAWGCSVPFFGVASIW